MIRSKRVNENITIKYVCMQNFMFVGVSVIEILEFNQKKKMKKNCEIPYYIGFTRFCRFFSNIISFQHILHFGIGRSQIEWNMKVKIEISICTGLMLNDHSNPYIESTTVLSDILSMVRSATWLLYSLSLCSFSPHNSQLSTSFNKKSL